MRLYALAAALLLLLATPGCGADKGADRGARDGATQRPSVAPEDPDPTPTHAPATEPETVTVFFATDRARFAPDVWSYLDHFFWAAVVFFGGLVLLRMFGRMVKDEYRGRVRFLWFVWAVGSLLLIAGGVYTALDVRQDLARQKVLFGGGRYQTHRPTRTAVTLDHVLQFGRCTVSVPPNRVIGEVRRPSFWKGDWFEDPARHHVALDVERTRADAFFGELRSVVAASNAKDAFVFVHGYNVSFEEAVIRTGQIKHDLEFQGPAIAYSWPSQGQEGKYKIDEANVGWTVAHLHRFLLALEERLDAERIHLIAHSMGSRALGAALLRIALERQGKPPLFNEIVFAAPDIDRDTFQQYIAPGILGAGKRVTLYASSRDDALGASELVHGSARAGDTAGGVVVVEGMDTIDVSRISGSHSYIGNSGNVLGDLKALFSSNRTLVEKPGFRAAEFGDLPYWILEFVPADR